MEVAIPQIRFCRSIWVIQKLNIDEHVISMRRTQSGVLNRSMKRAQDRVLDHSMSIQYISVEVSCHTDSNCILLRCLIRQLRGIILYFDIFTHSIVEFHSFMVHNRGLGWGQRQCPRILYFRWRGSTSYLVIVVQDIYQWNVYSCVDWRWHSW